MEVIMEKRLLCSHMFCFSGEHFLLEMLLWEIMCDVN